MKILLVVALCMTSGPVGCFDVTAYSGGSIILFCTYRQREWYNEFFCKEAKAPSSASECVIVKPDQVHSTWNHEGRLSITHTATGMMVVFKQLSFQDAGTYQCGDSGVWNINVNLKVNTDPCCTSPQTVSAYLRKTISINCSYPQKFETHYKYFYKLYSGHFINMVDTTNSEKDRFSLFDDKRSKVFTVNIRDVVEDDGGVYFCAAGIGGQIVSYFSLHTEIHLKITGSSLSVSITVSLCVALLLIGGSALIFYKVKKQDETSRRSKTNTPVEYENDPPGNQSITMRPVYLSPDSNTNQPASFYQDLDPESREPDSVYQSLNPNSDESYIVPL